MNFKFTLSLNQDNEWFMDRHHFHENIEVLLSLSHAGSFFADGQLFPLKRGTLILMQNTLLHKTIAHECELYKRYVLHFSKDVLKKISTPQSNLTEVMNSNVKCVHLNETELNRLILHFEKSRTEAGNGFGCDLRRSISFVELLLEISTHLTDKENTTATDNPDFNRLDPVIKYINNHLDETLNLDLLSKRFFMNKYHLSRIFKSATGFTIMDYVINTRVLKAREYLRYGHSVQEAGELAGFNSNAHFIRTFGKISGQSPGKYMKAYRKNMSDSK